MKRKLEEKLNANRKFKPSLPIPELPAELNLQIFSFFNKKERLNLRDISKTWNSFIFGEDLRSIKGSEILKRALSNADFRQIVLNNSQISSKLSNTEIYLLEEINTIGYPSLFIKGVYDRRLRLEIMESPLVLNQYSSSQQTLLEDLEEDYQRSRGNPSHKPIRIEARLFKIAKSNRELAIAIIKSVSVQNNYVNLKNMVKLAKEWPAVSKALLSHKERFQALIPIDLFKCAQNVDLREIDFSLIERINEFLKTQPQETEYELMRKNIANILQLKETKESIECERQKMEADDYMLRIQEYYNKQVITPDTILDDFEFLDDSEFFEPYSELSEDEEAESMTFG